MAASSPAPGVCPGSVVEVGVVVGVVPTGAEPGRHTSWYLSSSGPLVVLALAWIFALPLSSSPFLSGPRTGTAKSTGGEHVDAVDGSPSAATAASSALVSIFLPFLSLALKWMLFTWAELHLGSAGSACSRQIIRVTRHDPLRTPSASHGSPSA